MARPRKVEEVAEENILTQTDISEVNKALEELASQELPSMYAQKGIVPLRYIGKDDKEFRQGLIRPYPILKTNDIVFIDIKSASFMTRPNGGFEKLDISDIKVQG